MSDRQKQVIADLIEGINFAEQRGYGGLAETMKAALSMLKAQEQEINRLKHHIDCDAAEKTPSGCVGYGRGFNDDEPCETCKMCEKYNLFGVE